MRKLFFWLLVLCAYTAHAQYAIDSAEYFIDNDPGVGHAIRINTARPDSFSLSVNIGLLTTGIHTLCIRTHNDSVHWSLTESREFFVTGAPLAANSLYLDSAEYFIDTDPGVGAGHPLRVDSTSSLTTLEASLPLAGYSLSRGFHTLSIRTRNNAGRWSLSEPREFYVDGPALAATDLFIDSAEYFIDTDPGVGAASPLSVGTAAASISFTPTIPAGPLTVGIHSLFVRTRNSIGGWSLNEPRIFNVVPNVDSNQLKIVAAEYFIDTDPGVGQGTGLPVAGAPAISVSFLDTITHVSYPYGRHWLVIRSKDSLGHWSLNQSDTFNIFPCHLTVSDSITTNVSCHGAGNGIIVIAIHDSLSGPYHILWNNHDTTQRINNMSGGIDTVTVTDREGCAVTLIDTVFEPQAISINNSVSNPHCAGYTDGYITISTSGGVAPYRFHWSNADTTAIDSNLAAGHYYLTVTDASNCTTTASYYINAVPTIATSVQDSFCLGSTYLFNGQVLTSGGTYRDTLSSANGCDSIVTLHLAFTAGITNNISDTIHQGGSVSIGIHTYTQPGGYTDTLISVGGCDSIVTLQLSVLTSITAISSDQNLWLQPNPNTGIFTLTSSGATGQEYSITDMLGKVVKQDKVKMDKQVIDLRDAADGMYTLTVNGAQPIRFVVMR